MRNALRVYNRQMPGDRDRLLQHYRERRAALLAAIDRWSVVDHLAHLTLWDDIRAEDSGVDASLGPREGPLRAAR